MKVVTNSIKRIMLSDVSARDGLQSLKKVLSFQEKDKLINDLSKCNFDEIEVGSLVNYKIIPTMKNSLSLYINTRKLKSVSSYYLLIGNSKGIDIVNKEKVKNISFFTSPSDTFNLKNINLNTKDSFIRIGNMINKIEDRNNVNVKGYISCIGSCPFEGDVNIKNIIDSVCEFKKIGVDEICLADTIGDLKKEKLSLILGGISDKIGYNFDKLSLHLHVDFESEYWKENIKEALKYNISKYDTSILNLGGCPAIYKKCSSTKLNGNLNIIDACEFFINEGYKINVDIDKIKKVEGYWKDKLIR